MSVELKLPKLGVGCSALANWAYQSNVSKDDAVSFLKYCLTSGVTHFDTALMYGPHISEMILGEALKGYCIILKTGEKI